jgi:hypothetical protein
MRLPVIADYLMLSVVTEPVFDGTHHIFADRKPSCFSGLNLLEEVEWL